MSRVAEEKKEPRFCENEHLVCLNGEEKCPLCGGELSSTVPTEDREISAYSREAHNRDIAGYDKSQNALCFVVIGGTVFTIGILFIFLSLQKKFNKIVGINVASFQFAMEQALYNPLGKLENNLGYFHFLFMVRPPILNGQKIFGTKGKL